MAADEQTANRLLAGSASAAAQRQAAAARRAGWAVTAVDSPAAMIAALDADWSIAVAFVDAGLATPALVQRLARAGAPRVVALVDPAAADAAGLLLGVAVAFLDVDADDADVLAALEAALPPPEPRGVAELSDRSAQRLGALSAEVERIADALARLAQREGGRPVTVTATQVRTIIKRRRLRERYLPAELFADPAWDMLLDLTAAELEGRAVSVSSLCIAAAVPTTTALRWIRQLCDGGLFERRLDPDDARRAFIVLTPTASQAMRDYLAAAGDGVS